MNKKVDKIINEILDDHQITDAGAYLESLEKSEKPPEKSIFPEFMRAGSIPLMLNRFITREQVDKRLSKLKNL